MCLQLIPIPIYLTSFAAVGAPLAGRISDGMVTKYRIKRGKIIPEDRMRACWIGLFMFIPVSVVYGTLFHYGNGQTWALVSIAACLFVGGIAVSSLSAEKRAVR